MVIIEVTQDQAEIIKKSLQNHIDLLDKSIPNFRIDSIKKFAIERKAKAKVALETTVNAIQKFDSHLSDLL